jgi:hypothetical protein
MEDMGNCRDSDLKPYRTPVIRAGHRSHNVEGAGRRPFEDHLRLRHFSRAVAVTFAACLFAVSSPARAQETTAGQACTGAELNHIRSNMGRESSGEYHLVICNGTTWVGLVTGNLTGVQLPVSIAVTGDISPSAITANQNDYAPTGLASATVLRLASDASRNITGLTGGADGRVLKLMNVGSNPLVLKNQDAASTAANRFAIGSDITLAADQAVSLIYDSTSQRWRAGGLPFSQGGGGAPNCTDDSTATCILDSDRDSSDPEFTAANIRFGVNILGVTGTSPGQGVVVGGATWYFGGDNQSCTSVCSFYGLSYNTATLTYAGSSGSNANCQMVLDALGAGSGGISSGPCGGQALGCMLGEGTRARCTSPATTAGAAQGGQFRACACQ